MPFEVLLDEDGSAAELLGVGTLGLSHLVKPGQLKAGGRAALSGKRQHKTGRRPFQLGGTLVIAPGDELLYADLEDFAGDHADLDEVIAVVAAR